MKYNLKITEYPDNIQVSYYDICINRRDDDFETNNSDDKYHVGDSLSEYWYNSKIGKMEMIPSGYTVQLDPFTGDEVLCLIEKKNRRGKAKGTCA